MNGHTLGSELLNTDQIDVDTVLVCQSIPSKNDTFRAYSYSRKFVYPSSVKMALPFLLLCFRRTRIDGHFSAQSSCMTLAQSRVP